MYVSTEGIIASFIISTVGFSFFIYGKKQGRLPQLIAGMLLMASPFVVRDALWMWCCAGGALLAMKLALHFESRAPAG